MRLYIDGQLASQTPNTGLIPADPAKATIEIGGSPVAAAIDEVRILGVARVPAVPTGPAQADADTLLLDHFEDYDTPGVTAAGVTPPGAKAQGEVRGLHLFGPGASAGDWSLTPAGRERSWRPWPSRVSARSASTSTGRPIRPIPA